jgi:hypothetical protein
MLREVAPHPSIATQALYSLGGIFVMAAALPMLILPIWALVAFVRSAFAWFKTGDWVSDTLWQGIAHLARQRPTWDW